MAVFATTKAGQGPFWHGAGGVAAAAQGEIAGISWADKATIVISGLTGETVSITALLMGSAIYTGKIRPIDLTTGTVPAASDLGNGSYEIKDMAFDSLKFTKTSTSEVPVITVVLKGRATNV